MNLKLVVVSMSLLGLVSSPLFADTMHKHKHKRHHHHVASHDYKAMGSMPMQTATVVEAPAPMAASMTNAVLESMTQNVGTPRPMPEWFNRVGVSGGVVFDTGKWGNTSATNYPYNSAVLPAPYATGVQNNLPQNRGYAGENVRRFSLNPVFVNVSADVNEWSKAFVSLTYTGASNYYSSAYLTSNTFNDNNDRLNMEQGFLRIANFDCTPFFLEVGKEYQDFGRYTLHPITRSMTQVLSETLRTSIKGGFVTDMGFNGSLALFQDAINKTGSGNPNINYVAALGYANPGDQLGYDLGVAYMYNMFGVNDVGQNRLAFALATGTAAGYQSLVGAIAAYADLNVDAFTFGARYVSASKSFDPLDYKASLTQPGTGAKPWAAGVQAAYDFNGWNHNQNVYLGYQASGDGVFLNLPRGRFQVGYNVDAYRNTTLGAEFDHDISYSVAQGGAAAGNTNLISLRAAVKFG